jgi:hypothetical protein
MITTNHEGERESRGAAGPSDRTYDLAVAYRICPKVSRPAEGLPFADDKLRQAEIFLRSFRNSLGSLRVKIWAILDGCPEEYRELFERYFARQDLVLVDLPGVGNQATFGEQMDILLSQRDAEFVYFAEDDYLYLPDQFQIMLRFLRDRQDVDFVTPYDCLDYYRFDLHREPELVTVLEGHHWRTAASTCLTFLTRTSTLARYELVFRKYSRLNDDFPLWLSLTKRRVFNPLALFRYFARREFYWKILVKAWLICWPQILFGKRAKLWVPVPAIATHWCAGHFSAGFDWLGFLQAEARFDALPVAATTHPAGIERTRVKRLKAFQDTEGSL